MERPYFSEMLFGRRRELGYSIRQASRVLRLREDVLVAFEEGDFEQMPKSGYAQGMLSSYARYLGLDANEVVEAYAEDYEQYKRDARRRGASNSKASRSSGRRGSASGSGSKQPYVGSRGLLPTSGGLAGDMGSFATTRVHTRAASSYEEGDDNGEEPEISDRMTERPYTRSVPSGARRAYRQSGGRAGREIQTISVEGYDDDLRLGRDARPYEAASTRSGRRSSRNIANSQRPRVRGKQGQASRGRKGDRGRSRGTRNGSSRPLFRPNMGLIIAVVAVVAISLIIVLSVGSCVRQGTSSSKTIPVSAASSASSSSSSSASSSSQSSSSQKGSAGSSSSSSSDGNASNGSSSSSSSSSSSNKETSVSVSVADGAVTWLEVECDGKSDVAETVTGPWQKTYTVEESLSVQAGDTSSVSVVQNGKQVQFESMASGIGSIRIQGSKKSGGSSSSSSSKTGSSSSEGTSAKTGNASSKGEQEGQAGGADASTTGQTGQGSQGGQTGQGGVNGGYGYENAYGTGGNSGYGTESGYGYDYGY